MDGSKATLEINNYLGGAYHLTADEVVVEGSNYVIQESKNCTSGFLPSISDIKDGLFKLILFSNLDSLQLNSNGVDFSVRLKLTGTTVIDKLQLPCTQNEFEVFLTMNKNHCTPKHIQILRLLNEETTLNPRLTVEIGRNF